jgi:CheY-like chemotaxis protein
MNAIIGLSHILLQTDLDKKQRDYLLKIKNSSDNLLGIVNDILDFSKIESGKLDVEYIEFDINSMFDHISSVIGVKAEERGLELIFNIDKSVPAIIKGDPLRLGQVIINLMSNAVKFTDSGEVILTAKMFATQDKREYLKFEVIDTGIGITSDQINKLFRSFSQADSSISRKYGGTGLGLTISKQLVNLMGGTISVESEYGHGSKFTFTISTEVVEHRSYRLPSKELMKKRVLIADSSAKTSSALAHMLQYFQYTTLYAYTQEETRLHMSENIFDILFIERGMIDSCDRDTLNRDPYMKIVIMDSGLELLEEKIYDGISVDRYLKKPFNQKMIFDTILELYSDENIDSVEDEGSVTKDDLLVLSGSRILLAEDNHINQTVILGLLEDTGIEIIIANNGQEAIDQLKSYDGIELILMDINMPIMDGYEAAAYIRRDPKYDLIPMIALTANAMQGDFDKTRDLGMQEHLTKPIDVEMLYRYLLKYIEPKVALSQIDKTDSSVDRQSENKKYKELNVEEGLKHTGANVELYNNVLVDFVYMFNDSATQIEEFISKKEYDKASQLLHNIKGTSSNIGAINLFNITMLFETAIRNKESNFDLLLDSYKKTFENLTISINSFLEDEEKIKNSKKMIIQSDLNELLSEIYVQAKKRRALVCKQLAADLESYEWPDEYKESLGNITNALKQYRFKNAITTIEEML